MGYQTPSGPEIAAAASAAMADPVVLYWWSRGVRRADSLTDLVYATQEAVEAIDDEIANWTMPDVVGGLQAAQWALLGHFPKTCGSELRGALDLGMMCLYFHVRELEYLECNDDPLRQSWNQYFNKWDQGRPSPNWGEMKPGIQGSSRYELHVAGTGMDPVSDAHKLFHRLSAYTHSRAWTTDDGSREPITMIGSDPSKGTPPDLLIRFELLAIELADALARCWLAIFPELSQIATVECEHLLTSQEGMDTLAWAQSRANDERKTDD